MKPDVSQPAFGYWQTYTPTYTGFSVAPSGGVLFATIGEVLLLSVHPTAGTSNATGFTITLPSGFVLANNVHSPARIVDNGVAPTSPGLVEGITTQAVLTIYKDFAGAAWTASGSKNATFLVAVPIVG